MNFNNKEVFEDNYYVDSAAEHSTRSSENFVLSAAKVKIRIEEIKRCMTGQIKFVFNVKCDPKFVEGSQYDWNKQTRSQT